MKLHVSWLFNVLLWGASALANKNRIHGFYEVAQSFYEVAQTLAQPQVEGSGAKQSLMVTMNSHRLPAKTALIALLDG